MSSSKKAVALQLLERSSVFIHLDPRREGVMVPHGFVNQPQLVLQIGFDMAVSIPDLEVDEEGISCTLSFNRQRHFCRMPWSAIFALIGQNGGGRVWRNDVPPEVVEQRAAADQAVATKNAPAKRPHLRAVGGSEAEEQTPEPEEVKPAVADAACVEEEKGPAKLESVADESNSEPELPDLGSAAAARVELSDMGVSPKAGPRLVEPAPAVGASASTTAEDAPTPPSKPRPQEARSPRPTRSRPPYLRLVE